MGDVYTTPPQSRNEAILESIVEGTEYTDPPQSRIEDLLLDVKEVIEQGGGGGTTVVANPEGTATDDLNKLQVGQTIYAIPEGTEVEANPQDSASETLTKLKVDDTIYSIPNGGGGGGTSDYTELTNKPEINGNTLAGNMTGAELGLVDAVNGKGLSTNDFTDAFETKLEGIAVGAEVNVQADWTEADNTADSYIQNKPNLATVATSGSYNDLSNKPSIPAAQVQADWSEADDSAVDFIKNKPNLATVATSGSYNDLSNKPTIPAAQVNADWNASSGVAEILNKPNIPAAQVNSDWNASSGVAEILNKPTIPSISNCYETTDSAETTLADDDYVPFLQDGNTPTKKKIKWSNIKSVLSGLFCKISAIGTNETGTTASKPYAVGEHFYKNGKFCTCTQAIAQGAQFTLGTNYVEGTVANELDAKKYSYSWKSSKLASNSVATLYKSGKLVSIITQFEINTALTSWEPLFKFDVSVQSNNISFAVIRDISTQAISEQPTVYFADDGLMVYPTLEVNHTYQIVLTFFDTTNT